MKHYLIIGHAAFYEEEWRHMKFDDEQPTKRLKKEFIKQCRKDGGWDKDKEIYVNFFTTAFILIRFIT